MAVNDCYETKGDIEVEIAQDQEGTGESRKKGGMLQSKQFVYRIR